MTLANDLIAGVGEVLTYGEQVRFKYYNQTNTGSYYDDNVALTQSGNDLWTSGVLCPINNKYGSYEAVMLQQGKLLVDDKKLYVAGEIQTSGLGPIKIGMVGSPTTKQYQIIGDGEVINWGINGSSVCKKIYVRYLTNGSFIGE